MTHLSLCEEPSGGTSIPDSCSGSLIQTEWTACSCIAILSSLRLTVKHPVDMTPALFVRKNNCYATLSQESPIYGDRHECYRSFW